MIGRVDDDENIVEGTPAREIVIVRSLGILTHRGRQRYIGILPGEFLLDIVIAGGQGIVAAPLDGILRQQGFINPFFRDDREAGRNKALEQIRVTAVAEQGLVGGILVDEIDHLIRHDVHIRLAAIDKIQVGIVLAGLDD